MAQTQQIMDLLEQNSKKKTKQLENDAQNEQEMEEKYLMMLSNRKRLRNARKQTAEAEIIQYRKISNSLNHLQAIKRENEEKLQNLQKNVAGLKFMHKQSVKQTYKIQNKLNKLQDTQKYVYYLQGLKQNRQKLRQDKWEQRQKFCYSFRESGLRNKRLSQGIFNSQKEQRIRQIKQNQIKLKQSHRKSLSDLADQKKRKVHQIRESEMNMKEKFRRYSQYKHKLAQINYSQKLERQYKKHLENKKYLKQLKTKQKEQSKLFKKTQVLKEESQKIQSVYLTGVD